MLTIRLTRKGKKNQPFFRVVIIDKRRSSKGGRTVEDLGYVDPLKKRKSFKKERIQYWLSKGAKPSATIHNLLVSEKIIDAKKIHVSKLSKKKQAEIDTAKAKAAADKEIAEAQKSATPASASAEATADKEAEKPAEEAKPVEEFPSASSGQEAPVEAPKDLSAPEEPAQSPLDNEADKEEKSIEEVPVELPPAETPTEIEAPKEPASGEAPEEKTEA